MPGRRTNLPAASIAAVVTLVLTLLLAAAALGFALANRGLPVEEHVKDPPPWNTTQNAISALVLGVPGWYLASRRPRVPFGWLLLAAAAGHALTAFGWAYVIASLVGGEDLPLTGLGLWFAAWGLAVEVPVFAAVMVFFPDAERPRGFIGNLGLACLAMTVLGVFASMTDPFDGIATGPDSAYASLRNPIAIDFLARYDQDGVLWFGPPMAILTVLLIVRWLRTAGERRDPLRWLVVSQLAGIVFAPFPLLTSDLFLLSVQLPGILAMPIIVAGVLRHRVYGIHVVVQRTFVYATLVVVVALVYAGVVGATTFVAGNANQAASAVAAVIAALTFAPARSKVEGAVNRMLFGRRSEPYSVLSDVGVRLDAAASEDELLPEFVVAVASALRIPYVAVEIGEGPAKRLIETGAPQEGVERFPMSSHGTEIGHLLIGLRPGERAISAAERKLLHDLARQASGAAARLALTEDLQQSRERIVTAREEERRRLRRDLHDGLGPVLTGAAMLIDAARNTVRSDETAADQQLVEARSQVRNAIDDVRRLVYELRPPALDELGLLGAVREQAGRLTVSVDVEADDPFPELPAAVEVAAYRIIVEALTNAARHSSATRCMVNVHLNGRLEIEVLDDGTGAADWRPGIGISSMRERASELGGNCEAGPDGAGRGRVFAVIPVGSL